MIARDRYSRMVSLLKVAFPLGALAILSTLFLLARAMETDTPIPFADIEIQERLRDQKITGPFFSGTTQTGDQMSFSAKKLLTPQGNVGTNRAEEVKATLETTKGAIFELEADVAELDIAGNAANLSGAVSMATSTGYRITTEQITSQISTLDVRAPEMVEATGPLGTFTAGNMRIFSPNDAETTQMLFSGGVKLVYTPN